MAHNQSQHYRLTISSTSERPPLSAVEGYGVPLEEQLWQENTSLKAKLEQLGTQQQFNSNLHSPKVTAAIDLTSS